MALNKEKWNDLKVTHLDRKNSVTSFRIYILLIYDSIKVDSEMTSRQKIQETPTHYQLDR